VEPLALCALIVCVAAIAAGLAIMVVLLCRPGALEPASETTARETSLLRRAHASIAICFIVAGASAVVLVGAEAHGRGGSPTADAGLWRLLPARVDVVGQSIPRPNEHTE